MPILHRLLNEEVKHTLTVLSNHFTPRHLFKRNQSICPNRNLYTNVHSSYHDSQKMETTQMSINRLMNKQIGGISIQW